MRCLRERESGGLGGSCTKGRSMKDLDCTAKGFLKSSIAAEKWEEEIKLWGTDGTDPVGCETGPSTQAS